MSNPDRGTTTIVARASASCVSLALIATLLLASMVNPAHGQGIGNEGWVLGPGAPPGEDLPDASAWELRLAQGSSTQVWAVLSNVGTTTETLRLRSSDAAEGVDGIAPTDTEEGVGSWVEFPSTLVSEGARLEPGERVRFSFTVHVPEGAELTEHLGAVLALEDVPDVPEPGPDEVAVAVGAITEVGAALVIEVIPAATSAGGDSFPVLPIGLGLAALLFVAAVIIARRPPSKVRIDVTANH